MSKKPSYNQKWIAYLALIKSQYPKIDKYGKYQKASIGYQNCMKLEDLEEQRKCLERGIPPKKRKPKCPPLPTPEKILDPLPTPEKILDPLPTPEQILDPLPAIEAKKLKNKTRTDNILLGRQSWEGYFKRVREEYPELTYKQAQQLAKTERQKCNRLTDPVEKNKCYESGFKKKIVDDLTQKLETVIEAVGNINVGDIKVAQEVQSDVNSVIATFPISSNELDINKADKFLNKLNDLENVVENLNIPDREKYSFSNVFGEIKSDIIDIANIQNDDYYMNESLDVPPEYEVRKSEYFNEIPKLKYVEEGEPEPEIEEHTIVNTPLETVHEQNTKGLKTYRDKGHTKIHAGHTIINIYNYANTSNPGNTPEEITRFALSTNHMKQPDKQILEESLDRHISDNILSEPGHPTDKINEVVKNVEKTFAQKRAELAERHRQRLYTEGRIQNEVDYDNALSHAELMNRLARIRKDRQIDDFLENQSISRLNSPGKLNLDKIFENNLDAKRQLETMYSNKNENYDNLPDIY